MSVIKFGKYSSKAIFVQIRLETPAERINIIEELRSEFEVGLKAAKDMLENGTLFPHTPDGNMAAVYYMGRVSNLNAQGILPGFLGFTVGMWETPYRQEPYRWVDDNNT